ncbi:site-2 protease family protein [Candidatus Micrarchaeota archaeon]|nr:site-2 protease family protein [Candidatus Micrarchaeota archaeon]
MGYEWILAVIALAIVPAYIFRYALGVKTYGPGVMWRTMRGLKLLDSLASRNARAWRAIGDAGAVFAFGVFGAYYVQKTRNHNPLWTVALYAVFLVSAVIATFPDALVGKQVPLFLVFSLVFFGMGGFAVAALAQHTLKIILDYFTGGAPVPGIQPIIPGVEIPGAPITVPLSALVGLVVLIIVHELSHGILSRVEKINVSSLGILTLGIFPIGAFCETDEKQLAKAKRLKRMRVLTAGSMANIITGFAFLGVLTIAMLTLYPALQNELINNFASINVSGVMNGSPAALAGMSPGTIIYNPAELLQPANRVPGGLAIIDTSKGPVAMSRDEKGFVGISGYVAEMKGPLPLGYWTGSLFIEALSWIVILNFLIGVINFMPFAIFDGARIFRDLLEFYGAPRKLALKATMGMTYLILVFIIINVIPYFVR